MGEEDPVITQGPAPAVGDLAREAPRDSHRELPSAHRVQTGPVECPAPHPALPLQVDAGKDRPPGIAARRPGNPLAGVGQHHPVAVIQPGRVDGFGVGAPVRCRGGAVPHEQFAVFPGDILFSDDEDFSRHALDVGRRLRHVHLDPEAVFVGQRAVGRHVVPAVQQVHPEGDGAGAFGGQHALHPDFALGHRKGSVAGL